MILLRDSLSREEPHVIIGEAARAHIEDQQAGILRHHLYFSCTNNVPTSAHEAVKEGVTRLLYEAGKSLEHCDFGNWQAPDLTEHNSPGWYQEQSLIRRERRTSDPLVQVSVTELDTLLREGPWQEEEPHYDVLVVDEDLWHPDYPESLFVYGFGAYPNTVISAKSLVKDIRDPTLRHQTFAVIAAHEMGHNLDLVRRTYNVGQGKTAAHCLGESGPCLMEQNNVPGGRSLKEQITMVYEQDNLLCRDCTEEVHTKKSFMEEQNLQW